MTDPKKDENKAKSHLEEEFAALPLEEKIAFLMRMEASTLGETLTYIANSSAKAVEKAGDFIHDVGVKIENEVKKAAASAGASSSGSGEYSAPKAKAASAKRPPKPKAAK